MALNVSSFIHLICLSLLSMDASLDDSAGTPWGAKSQQPGTTVLPPESIITRFSQMSSNAWIAQICQGDAETTNRYRRKTGPTWYTAQMPKR